MTCTQRDLAFKELGVNPRVLGFKGSFFLGSGFRVLGFRGFLGLGTLDLK